MQGEINFREGCSCTVWICVISWVVGSKCRSKNSTHQFCLQNWRCYSCRMYASLHWWGGLIWAMWRKFCMGSRLIRTNKLVFLQVSVAVSMIVCWMTFGSWLKLKNYGLPVDSDWLDSLVWDAEGGDESGATAIGTLAYGWENVSFVTGFENVVLVEGLQDDCLRLANL